MSLYLLNERRTDVAPEYRRNVRGLARAVPRRHRAVELGAARRPWGAFYTAFGTLVFDVLAPPHECGVPRRGRVDAPSLGLPADLEDAMETDEHDEAMRRSHDAGLARVGGEVWYSDDPHPRRHGLLRARAQRDPARRRRAACLRGCSAARRLPRVLRAEADPVAAARLHLIHTVPRAQLRQDEHMSAMTTHDPDLDEIWTAIDDHRAAPWRCSRSSPTEQRQHPSLCEGRAVRDVAAHYPPAQSILDVVRSSWVEHPRLLCSVGVNRYDPRLGRGPGPRLPTDRSSRHPGLASGHDAQLLRDATWRP